MAKIILIIVAIIVLWIILFIINFIYFILSSKNIHKGPPPKKHSLEDCNAQKNEIELYKKHKGTLITENEFNDKTKHKEGVLYVRSSNTCNGKYAYFSGNLTT